MCLKKEPFFPTYITHTDSSPQILLQSYPCPSIGILTWLLGYSVDPKHAMELFFLDIILPWIFFVFSFIFPFHRLPWSFYFFFDFFFSYFFPLLGMIEQGMDGLGQGLSLFLGQSPDAIHETVRFVFSLAGLFSPCPSFCWLGSLPLHDFCW